MIAFFIFVALMVAFIVGSVCISLNLYLPNWRAYLPRHQLVTMNQEAFIEGGARQQRGRKSARGMGECVQRVGGISLVVVGIVLLIIIAFIGTLL